MSRLPRRPRARMPIVAPSAYWCPAAPQDPTASWMIAQKPATAARVDTPALSALHAASGHCVRRQHRTGSLVLEECRGHIVVPHLFVLWVVLVAFTAALVVMLRAHVRAPVVPRVHALGPATDGHAVHRAFLGLPKRHLLRRGEALRARNLATDVPRRVPRRSLCG